MDSRLPARFPPRVARRHADWLYAYIATGQLVNGPECERRAIAPIQESHAGRLSPDYSDAEANSAHAPESEEPGKFLPSLVRPP